MDYTSLPGILPREVIETALPLELPDEPEMGLLVSVCPGCPPEGVPYRPHRLRLKLLPGDVVDIYCPLGCEPQMLKAAIVDLYRKATKEAA